MGDASINYVGACHAALNGIQCAPDFREHASVYHAGIDQFLDSAGAEASEYLSLGIEQSRHIGEQHELLRLQHLCQFAGDQISVDVIGLAVCAAGNRRDDRNIVTATQHGENICIDTLHFPNLTDVLLTLGTPVT